MFYSTREVLSRVGHLSAKFRGTWINQFNLYARRRKGGGESLMTKEKEQGRRPCLRKALLFKQTPPKKEKTLSSSGKKKNDPRGAAEISDHHIRSKERERESRLFCLTTEGEVGEKTPLTLCAEKEERFSTKQQGERRGKKVAY